MDRISLSFVKVAAGKSPGDNLLPRMRRVKNHHGNTGIAKATALRWAAAGWVDVIRGSVGRARPIISVLLLSKGVNIANARQSEIDA